MYYIEQCSLSLHLSQSRISVFIPTHVRLKSLLLNNNNVGWANSVLWKSMADWLLLEHSTKVHNSLDAEVFRRFRCQWCCSAIAECFGDRTALKIHIHDHSAWYSMLICVSSVTDILSILISLADSSSEACGSIIPKPSCVCSCCCSGTLKFQLPFRTGSIGSYLAAEEAWTTKHRMKRGLLKSKAVWGTMDMNSLHSV